MGEIKESVAKEALENLNWPLLKNHFDDIGLDKESLSTFLGFLTRTNKLIMPYPNKKMEMARDAFFGQLNDYVKAVVGLEASDSVAAETALLNKIETVYRAILDSLQASDISAFPPDIRVAACIDRMAHQFAYVVDATLQAMATRKGAVMPEGLLLTDDTNQPVSPDRAVAAYVEALTSTIVMEAIINKWWDSRGYVLLPALPSVDDDLRFKAGSTEVLSLRWRHWRHTEERRRFLGGVLTNYVPPNLPSGLPEGINELTIYKPTQEEFFDYAANQRLADRFGQTFLEMMFETRLREKAMGISAVVPLPPDGLISPEEGHAGTALSEALSYSIVNDNEQPGGLRLLEWVRGYAVLKQLASDRKAADNSVGALVFNITKEELIELLCKCGLPRESADLFIDSVTLARSSRDLFDCPLIKMVDGTLLVFAPALIATNIAQVILSQLSNRGEPLEKKGKAFEQYILSFLTGRGLSAKSFKANREGQEYQYDVVLVWDNYVFLFECKNHALSHNHPIQAYYFGLEMESSAKQVKRLADALNRYPDILNEHFGIDVSQKTIVPCVLSSLPYSRFGQVYGAYFSDASALKRFFQGRYFFLKTPYQLDKDVTVLHRTAMHSLWSSDTASPEDLLRQLEEPFQLKLVLGHTELGSLSFVLNTQAFVSQVYRPTETTIESVSSIFGLSEGVVRKEMDFVRDKVLETIKKREKKQESD